MIINVNDGQYIIEVNFNLYNGGTNLLTLYAYSNSTCLNIIIISFIVYNV